MPLPYSASRVKKLLFALLLLPALAHAQPANYWQQQVDYLIRVQLDDQHHVLRGTEEIAYKNNSPTSLPSLWFHLWPNAYRDNTTAFARQQQRDNKRKYLFAKPEDRGYIDSLDFRVNGSKVKVVPDPSNPDIVRLDLTQPIIPGGSVNITTPFRVKVPASFSRLGHVGQSYQISQWYPKPAVFDRRGWHPMPYLDQGEFYSEYGSFDVSITLPANYTVGATGVLQNADEVARLRQLAAADAGKKTAADFGTDQAFPPSDATMKTLRYKQDRVHDFAWFADKRFHVLQDSVTLPSGRSVQAMVLFTNKEPVKWVKGLQDVKDALYYYSKWVGEYPYASATAVDGALVAGGGMEYPMVTVTQPGAIVHEVGHNWFYGILGSNERDYPWMDEGVNSYLEGRVSAQDTLHTSGIAALLRAPSISNTFGLRGLPPAAVEQVPYQALAARGLDQPVQGPTSVNYTTLNYGVVVYGKTAALLKYLAGYLGQEKFDAAMHEYYRQWQFKHPYPEDMQAVFEESTGQKLGWFFQEMLTNTRHYDAEIYAIATFKDVVKVLVTTTSPVPWAVPVSTVDAQGRILETLWTPPFGDTEADAEEEPTSQLNFRRQEGIAAVVVDAGYLTPQLNRRNDRLRLESGPLDRSEPLRLRPLASVERWDRKTISWLPVLGANTSDKLMLGAAFYNDPLVPKRFQYLAMPMYSFNRNELNGIGTVQLNVLPARISRQTTIAFTVQRFERYVKYEPSLSFVLPHAPGTGPQHRITLANTAVRDEDLDRTGVFQALEYQVGTRDALQEWQAHVDLNRLSASNADDLNDRQAVLLRADASYLRFYSAKKRVQVRLFGGRFLTNPGTNFFIGLSGSPDYRRQTAFLDRQRISESLAAQTRQTDNRDGAFKAFIPVISRKWLSSLNFQADVPALPLAVFADFGLTADDVFYGRRTYYDAGLSLPLIRNVLEFYFPVAGTQYVDGLPASFSDFSSNIRFMLNLREISPFRLLDKQLAQ